MGLHAILSDSYPDELPCTSCHICCPHDRLQEWRALSKARGGFLIFDRCGGCMEFFPPEEKIRFSGNGRIVLSGPCFQSPLLREQALLLVTEGGGGDSTLRTSGSCHLPGAADTAAATRMEAGRSRSQSCALESHEHFPRGRPRTKQIVLKK